MSVDIKDLETSGTRLIFEGAPISQYWTSEKIPVAIGDMVLIDGLRGVYTVYHVSRDYLHVTAESDGEPDICKSSRAALYFRPFIENETVLIFDGHNFKWKKHIIHEVEYINNFMDNEDDCGDDGVMHEFVRHTNQTWNAMWIDWTWSN